MQLLKLYNCLLIFGIFCLFLFGGCKQMRNACGEKNIIIDKSSYFVEQDVFDIIFSTSNNSGTVRSYGYYDDLLNLLIDLSEYRLCTLSDKYDCYCFSCQDLYLFLVFDIDGVNDYSCACLLDIYCTDMFYEFKDYANIQTGSRISDVEQIDGSMVYKRDYISSNFRFSKHLCKEGLITIEWEKDNDFAVKRITYEANELIKELWGAVEKNSAL